MTARNVVMAEASYYLPGGSPSERHRERILALWASYSFTSKGGTNSSRYDWFYLHNPAGVGRAYFVFDWASGEFGVHDALALGYPLSYPEVATVVTGTRSVSGAVTNFGPVPGYRLTPEELQRIAALQDSLGLRVRAGLLGRLLQVLRG